MSGESFLARVHARVWTRYRYSWIQLVKFSIVGGSGFIVNLAVFWAALTFIGSPNAKILALGFGDFHIRHYHLFAMLAFAVANVSNYLLNRAWTFRSKGTASIAREYVPFLVIGLAAQFVGLLILTAGIRVAGLDELVAQAVAIVLVTPVSYLGNKLWSFSNVRGKL